MSESDSNKPGLLDEKAFSETVVIADDEATSESPQADQAEQTEQADLLAPSKPGADGKPSKPPWAGKRLGRFKLLRLLGQGGMGMVIQAQDIHLGRIVALKVLRRQIKGLDDKQRVSQFLREAKSAAQIQHPNAAQVYEINEYKGWWYIATELIEGGTLHQIVKAAGKLTPAQACPLIADAASVLAAAHQAGIIHRDIKPHNLMLTRMGRCKVVDFGLVRMEDPNDPFDFTERAVGTPHYLPPEAAKRARPTHAYDIYALAATLYFALTGQPPYKGESMEELVELHANAPRPDVRELNPDCSERLATLIQQGMAVDPTQRPSAADFAATLRVESIGTDHDPATLIQEAAKAGHLDDPHAHASGISALPLTGTTGHGTRVIGMSKDGTLVVEHTVHDRWLWVTRVAAISVVLGVAIQASFWVFQWYDSPPQASDRAAFEQRFPNAPASYGTRALNTTPPSATPAPPPAFSWLGQVEPGDNRYVASKDGNKAYPIDHPAARLIRSDLARFFATRQDAERVGKTVIE